MNKNDCELLIAFVKYCVWEFEENTPDDSQIYDFFVENNVSQKYYSSENLIDDTNAFFQKILE